MGQGLNRSDFGGQIGMPLQYVEQLYERQRRLGSPAFVARQDIDPAAEDLSGFPLIDCKFLAQTEDQSQTQS